MINRNNGYGRSLKWIIPVIIVLTIGVYLFSSSGMGKIAGDLTQAYADEDLYTKAIEKANANREVIEMIGEIEPIDKMTILNGEVIFSEDDQIVSSTIQVKGTKTRAKMDFTANRVNENWQYEKINIRIKETEKNKRTIEIVDVP